MQKNEKQEKTLNESEMKHGSDGKKPTKDENLSQRMKPDGNLLGMPHRPQIRLHPKGIHCSECKKLFIKNRALICHSCLGLVCNRCIKVHEHEGAEILKYTYFIDTLRGVNKMLSDATAKGLSGPDLARVIGRLFNAQRTEENQA